jgi:hypothetical protein
MCNRKLGPTTVPETINYNEGICVIIFSSMAGLYGVGNINNARNFP